MRTYCSVDTAAVLHNVSVVRQHAPQSRVMAVVKGNAYGHGQNQIASALETKVDAFAVATFEEAVELRESGSKKTAVLLSGFISDQYLPELSCLNIDVVVYCKEQIEMLELASSDLQFRVWIKLNTGMNRLGFPSHQINKVITRVQACTNVRLVGIMSHFAVAEELNSNFTEHQIKRFLQATQHLSYPLSLANSAGILRWPHSHLNWVRPGLMLYGVSPFANLSAKQLSLRPAMELTSTIAAVNSLKAHESVGYGLTWTSKKSTRVGVVACGYADGYFRRASPGAQVLIDQMRANIIGRISMDTFLVDLSKHPQVRVGAKVTLFGKDLPAAEIAAAAGTVPYEVLTSVGTRKVHKVYK